jgi:DNA-binding transcriptional ArsR family regulator
VFFALSHEARRHIVLLLATPALAAVGLLAKRFQHSWPTTTRHLKVLEEAGLVEVRRHGRSSHYKLSATTSSACSAAGSACSTRRRRPRPGRRPGRARSHSFRKQLQLKKENDDD